MGSNELIGNYSNKELFLVAQSRKKKRKTKGVNQNNDLHLLPADRSFNPFTRE